MQRLRAILEPYPPIRQFIKFCLVGGSSALVNFSIYEMLIKGFGVWYVLAAAWGYAFSALVNFLSNKHWTFRDRGTGQAMHRQMRRFTLVLLGGLILNTSLIFLFTDLAGLSYRWSWVLATGLVTFWNFSGHRFWTFRPHPSDRLAGLPVSKT